MAAVAFRHEKAGFPSPVTDDVRALLAAAANRLRERPAGKQALTPSQLRKVCRAFTDAPIDVRDRAMFLLGFASGWRRSELAPLDISDLSWNSKGVLISLGASKTDQDGSEGRVVGIPRGVDALTCPVRALRAWLKVRSGGPGPLFVRISNAGNLSSIGLTGTAVNARLKVALSRVGIDPAQFGAHSLRAGMATAGAENGASEIAIMRRGGWKSITMVLRYVRPAKAFEFDPLKGVL